MVTDVHEYVKAETKGFSEEMTHMPPLERRGKALSD